MAEQPPTPPPPAAPLVNVTVRPALDVTVTVAPVLLITVVATVRIVREAKNGT
ncbi:MAG: hypothetical protein WD316_08580 [Phycisphaeraceae bacterium]